MKTLFYYGFCLLLTESLGWAGIVMVYDVAVIGAGVVGAMIARELMKYELSVCLLEAEDDVAMGASRANSGIVHAGFDAMPGSLKAKLNVQGSAMMEEVARELGVNYQRNGSLVVGFDEPDKKTLQILYERGNQNGVAGLRIVSDKELHDMEPNITVDTAGALYAPTGAIVCPYGLTIAAAGNAMDNGAELYTGFAVKEITTGNEAADGYLNQTEIAGKEAFFVLSSEHRSLRARYIVNAAGLYADTIARMVGDDSFAIHPRKGEYLLLDKEYGNSIGHTIFRTPTPMGKGILTTPTVDGNLLLGPTSQDITDKEDCATTRAGLDEVLQKTFINLPAKAVITSFCGLRAVGDTGDFIIRSPRARFLNVAGIESPGLSASPAIAVYAVELLERMGLVLQENRNFRPERKPQHWFRDLDMDGKNTVIANDKRYGRIVCRCEGITEGEIVEAIHTNPKATNLDAVKRRTRSGMGRCQGGFCTPHLVEILARELKIPYEAVTKCGGESRLNFCRTK